MKLLYATSIIYPSSRANRIQVKSMAVAFSRELKDNFILGLASYRDSDPFECSFIEMGSQRSYALAWKYIQYAEREGYSHIYCREERLLFFLTLYAALFRKDISFTYEIHHLADVSVWWNRFMLSRVDHIVSITNGTKDALIAKKYSASRILVAPDSVDLTLFNDIPTVEEARRELGFALDTPIILYTGSINEAWKGVGVLYESVAHTKSNCQFIVVGGKPHYVEEFKETHPDTTRFRMLGHKPHGEISKYMAAASVLVLPNSSKAEISRISTSPMKLFEYMAAARPIVASDLPSIREIVDESTAFLVTPDNPRALAKGIDMALNNTADSNARVQKARSEVARYTWQARAQQVLNFIAS